MAKATLNRMEFFNLKTRVRNKETPTWFNKLIWVGKVFDKITKQ